MYKRILVPVDGSPTALRGVEEAIQLATLTGGRLRLLHVVDDLSIAVAMDAYSGYAGDWVDALRTQGRQVLDEAQARVAAAGLEVDTVLYDSVRGRVYELALDEAQKWRADLIVIGTHGRRGFERLVLGSSAEQILRLSPVPVLLVRAVADVAVSRTKTAADASLRIHLPSGALALE